MKLGIFCGEKIWISNQVMGELFWFIEVIIFLVFNVLVLVVSWVCKLIVCVVIYRVMFIMMIFEIKVWNRFLWCMVIVIVMKKLMVVRLLNGSIWLFGI